jgi:hypothetical protein
VWIERPRRLGLVACNARRFVQAQEYAIIPASISRTPIFASR